MWDIIGHENIVKTLQHHSETDTPQHTYLLTGERHLGKMTIAKYFAQELLKTERLTAHPDFHDIDDEDAQTIGIKPIRTLISQAQKRPYQGKFSIILINEAEKLTTEASNALLKTLEEPPKHLILILITEQKEALLETILSRSTILQLHRIPQEELQKHYSGQLPASIQGKPGKLKRIEQHTTQHNEAIQQFQEIKKAPWAQKVKIIKKLTAKKENAIIQAEQWAILLQHKYHKQPSSQTQHTLQALLKALKSLKTTNASPQLIIESFFLNVK